MTYSKEELVAMESELVSKMGKYRIKGVTWSANPMTGESEDYTVTLEFDSPPCTDDEMLDRCATALQDMAIDVAQEMNDRKEEENGMEYVAYIGSITYLNSEGEETETEDDVHSMYIPIYEEKW